ncbi:monovalent cation/H+ antiporter subunit D family protein [Halocatena salina]|uniref:Monovalent cation/H+ antiporter subunit D family protein n=1 Tax=Halocatena salina TaxID=2934340 RepID=A0A8U0A5X0_9EURY|nr:monovalent cation/H+ antiporter subunit D family protein [Halocatena salina]UPM43888.1 monovalent cation/H+ antiporter subunit D family protein [Halocatena salina]
MTDLPALVIVFPIFASIVVLLFGLVRQRIGWPIATIASVVQVAMAGSLAIRGFDGDPVRYVVGGFTTPYGIELVIDGLSATMIVLVAVVALGVLGYARTAGPRSNSFYATYLLLVAGLTGMSATGDMFNMYVFLEITGLTAYALVASGKSGRSALAALKYLLVGTFGASLFLLGIGYAYVATGTLNMNDLSGQLAAVGHTSPLVQAAFGLLVVGLFVKIAVFPLHTWQPAAYAGAPDTVSSLISALVSTVSAYALLRIVFSVFTVDFLAANPFARNVLMAGATISIVVGSLLAVAQNEIKQLLAYSSVSQFGLIIGAIAVGNGTALTGAAIHLVGHAIMKGGLFLTSGLIGNSTGARTVEEFEGLGKYLPAGAGSFGIIALAMVGVPPTIGFVGKWYIALGAVEAQSWPLAVIILLSTLLTLAYFARLIERMYFREPATTTSSVETTETTAAIDVATDGTGTAPSMGMWMTVVATAVLSVVLGVVAFEYGQLLEPTIEHLLP